MPKRGVSKILRRALTVSHAKKSVAFAFLICGLIIVLGGFEIELGSLSTLADAQQRPARVQRTSIAPSSQTTIDDCSFMKEPDNIRGLQARHRSEISRLAEGVSYALEREGARLVTAAEAPRKNLIDNILFDRMATEGVQSAPLCSDAEFIRRVYLDLTGRIPSPADVTGFLADTNPYKRDVLVDTLIASPEFVDKWTLFFGDLYKNTSNATNIVRYIGGREAFHRYIRESVAENKRYDQMATEMITASGDSFDNGAVNFIVGGNVPMGPAQDTMDGLAVVTSTAFLGLGSMDCLLCHDGAGHLDQINLWGAKVTRAEAWGMSAFFARTTRTFVRVNQTANYGKYNVTEASTGEYVLNTNSGNRQTRSPINGNRNVTPKYLFGGGVNTGENRRQALARQIIADPQFSRAIVNYIWEELMIEALVSPSNTFDLARISPDAKLPDGWTLQPSNATLLETLSQEFSSNNFNLRYLIGMIAKSSAYQLSSQYPGTWKLEYVPLYARKFVRRLDAEEIHDAIVKATAIVPTTSYRDPGGTAAITIAGYPIMGDDGAKVREVQWAMQLPEPFEPRQNGTSRAFLDSFLRGNRDTNPRAQDSSILQALNLMNNIFVTNRTRQSEVVNVPNSPQIPSTVRRLLADGSLTNEQIITQLYLHTLSRYPTDAEKAKILPYYSSMTRQAATESLQWVLLNKVDFIFNY